MEKRGGVTGTEGQSEWHRGAGEVGKRGGVSGAEGRREWHRVAE